MENVRKSLGSRGESAAAFYLTEIGWNVIGRNLRYRGGEIDILAENKSTLVVVEVKVKSSVEQGYAVEMITEYKKRTLRRLADLVRREYNKPVRIDVIAIDQFLSAQPTITHYENAIGERDS